MIKLGSKEVKDFGTINGKNMSRVMFGTKLVWEKKQTGILPEEVSNGVYVYANDGLLYTPSEWDTNRNDDAVGVAVVTDNSKFCIGKGEKPVSIWSDELSKTDVADIINSFPGSSDDYKGIMNTNVIKIAAPNEDASNNAAYLCYSQTITVNGKTIHGYLPAISELIDASENKTAINNTIKLIDGVAIYNGKIWSSSEFQASYLQAWTVDWFYGESYGHYKYSQANLMPCFPILPTLVDLGLPSGTLWSTTNLGAFKPEDSGYYYQWGDTIGWTKEEVENGRKKFASDWSDYKFGSSSNFSKYNASDGKTVLDLEDDAAYITYGDGWRIPTIEDLIELKNNTTVSIDSVVDKGIVKLISKNNSNEISLFLNGYSQNSQFDYGFSSYFWLSNSYTELNQALVALISESGNFNTEAKLSRFSGLAIRPVYKP